MVQEASLDTLALAGAMTAAVFAALTHMLGRQSHTTPALMWWSAAFAVEALRLASIPLAEFLPGGRAGVVEAGGHAVVAIAILIGVRAWLGGPPRRQGFWALAGLATTLMLAGLVDSRAAEPAAGLLYALAAGSLLVAVWLFWRSHRSAGRPSGLFAGAALSLLMAHVALHAPAGLGIGTEIHGAGEWGALAHLGLSFLAVTSLVFTAQHRAFLTGRDAQDRLAASEQRFRDVAEIAGEWIWETGPDLRYTYFSNRVRESVGVDPKHLLGRTRRELMGEDMPEPHLRAHLEDLEARRSFRNFEYSFDPGVGGMRYLRVSGKPMYDARGQFLGYRGTGTDVTGEVVAKNTAARLENRLRDTFEGMPYGIALFDADDRLVMYNSKLETIFPNIEDFTTEGRTFEEILQAAANQKMFPCMDEELDRFTSERLDQHRAATGVPFQQPLADGRYVQVIETKTGDGGTITSWSDITWLRRHEAALALLLQSDPEDESFFEVAAEALSTGLDCHWAGISKLSGDRFEVLAAQGSGWPDALPSIEIKISPGGKIIESRGYLAIPDRVPELFPADKTLAERGIVSYQGQAFLDGEGEVLGHVFAMYDQPHEASSHDRELVGLIARWAGTEFERRRAKQSLSKSEQRFRDYAETSADWFWETDMEQCFASCVESAETTATSNITVGLTRDQIQRRIGAEPNLAPIVAGYMARGEAFRNLEFRFEDPERGTRWARISGKPVHDAEGKPTGYRGTGQDITERKRTELALQKSEARLRDFAGAATDWFWEMDSELRFSYFSEGMKDKVGIAPEHLLGRTRRQILEEGDLAPVTDGVIDAAAWQRHLADLDGHRPIRNFHHPRRLPNGETTYLSISATPVFDAEGSFAGYRGSGTNITEIKRTEMALRQKAAFIELSKITAAAANEASSVEEALETCIAEVCRHFGWAVGHAYVSAQDGSGELSPSMIWHVTDPEKFVALRQVTMSRRFASGEGLPGRVLATREPVWISDVRKDPDFPRAMTENEYGITAAMGFPVLIGTEVAAVLEFFAEGAVETDAAALDALTHIGKQIGRVIERARAEHKLRTAKDIAERANRSKGEFLANMSHELRTPLNAIIGFSEIMGQELYGPLGHETYKGYIDDIKTSGTHLLNIINDILDVSKAEAGMIELAVDSVDLAEIIESSMRLLKSSAVEKGLDFELDLPRTPTRLRGDRQRLSQVLLNLLSNAVKFTARGSITVRLRCDPDDGILLRISDTGIGIQEADLERIMEPFVQADSTLSRAHEGTGLGLPLSRVFVEAHDGQLTIESVFGKGSIATVRLPASRLLGAADAA